MALVLAVLLLLLPSLAYGATTYYVMSDGSSNTTGPADDCSVANVNATVVFASDGDTIICGAGTYNWTGAGSSWSGTAGTSLVQIRKALTIQGAGTMPTQGAATSGQTQLNINSTASVTAIDLRESTVGSITLANLHFYIGAATSIPSFGVIGIYPNVTTGLPAKPVILHHITMEYHQGTLRSVDVGTVHGLVYRSKFTNDNAANTGPTIQCKANSPLAQNNWAKASSFGSSDTDANLGNLYVETSYFSYHSATDGDDGCRLVFRFNELVSAALGGHGHDTSAVGVRHYEAYENTFSCPASTNWLSINPSARGGVVRIFNNVMPTTCLGSATVLYSPTLQALRRLMKSYDYRVQTTATFTTASSTIDVATTVGVGVGMAACTPDVSTTTSCSNPINFIKVTAVNDAANQVTLQSAPASNGTNATIRFDSCYPGPYPWARQHGWGWDPAGVQAYPFNVNDQISEPSYIWGNKNTSGGTPGELNSVTPVDGSFGSFPDGPCAWPTFTGTLTSGSPTVTSISPGTASYFDGMNITGTGIPASTTVSSVDSSTQLTLSANATASGAQTITLNNNNITTAFMVQSDRDYFVDSTSNPNCVASGTDCTSGIGRGTRAQRPSGGTLTNGVGWWATDQGGNWDTTNGSANDGCLDVVVSGAWSNCFYTPATYPHTLATVTGDSSSSDSGISGSLAPRGRPRWHGPHAKPDRRETP